MMKQNVKNELRNMSISDLSKRLDEWNCQLLTLRLNAVTSHVKDYSQFKKLRRNVACGLTILADKKVELLTKQLLAAFEEMSNENTNK